MRTHPLDSMSCTTSVRPRAAACRRESTTQSNSCELEQARARASQSEKMYTEECKVAKTAASAEAMHAADRRQRCINLRAKQQKQALT